MRSSLWKGARGEGLGARGCKAGPSAATPSALMKSRRSVMDAFSRIPNPESRVPSPEPLEALKNRPNGGSPLDGDRALTDPGADVCLCILLHKSTGARHGAVGGTRVFGWTRHLGDRSLAAREIR